MSRNALHPDDARTQVDLGARLTALRQERYSAVEFARRMGITANNLHGVEHATRVNMSALAVERRAAPLGLHLEVWMEGAPDAVEWDVGVMVLDMARSTTVTQRAHDAAVLAARRLQVARSILGVSEKALGDRMGVCQSTVNGLLQEASFSTRLSTIQRIARALEFQAVPRLIPWNG